MPADASIIRDPTWRPTLGPNSNNFRNPDRCGLSHFCTTLQAEYLRLSTTFNQQLDYHIAEWLSGLVDP